MMVVTGNCVEEAIQTRLRKLQVLQHTTQHEQVILQTGHAANKPSSFTGFTGDHDTVEVDRPSIVFAGIPERHLAQYKCSSMLEAIQLTAMLAACHVYLTHHHVTYNLSLTAIRTSSSVLMVLQSSSQLVYFVIVLAVTEADLSPAHGGK